MIQVDFFWSFAIGSSFAAAASRQLKKEDKPFENKYFVKTLLFLSLIFTPTFAYLGTQYPGWESMFALHPYLVNMGQLPLGVKPPAAGIISALCTIIYIGLGILGYYLAYRFIRKDNMKATHALWIFGYLGLGFMALIGWDGTGFERLTFAGTWQEWHQWKVLGGANTYVWTDFFASPVMKSIVVIGVFVLPPLGWVYFKWPRISE